MLYPSAETKWKSFIIVQPASFVKSRYVVKSMIARDKREMKECCAKTRHVTKSVIAYD